jgi:hypothetical protein
MGKHATEAKQQVAEMQEDEAHPIVRVYLKVRGGTMNRNQEIESFPDGTRAELTLMSPGRVPAGATISGVYQKKVGRVFLFSAADGTSFVIPNGPQAEAIPVIPRTARIPVAEPPSSPDREQNGMSPIYRSWSRHMVSELAELRTSLSSAKPEERVAACSFLEQFPIAGVESVLAGLAQDGNSNVAMAASKSLTAWRAAWSEYLEPPPTAVK